MIENKSLGSKIFDVLNVVFLVIVMLICIMPVWYVFLWQRSRCQERKSSSPIKESSCGFLYFVCYSTVVLFHGISL